jgi:4-hydroxybenzoate polyprenyltransferase
MRHFFAYAQLVRLPNTFSAIADILLGALATGWVASRWSGLLQLVGLEKSGEFEAGRELRAWTALLCLMTASTLLYWSGMIWNDYFDLDQDRKERPSRPLANGRIALSTAQWLGFGLMAGGLFLAWLTEILSESTRWCTLPIAGALVLAIFLYDGVFKKTWAGPILMGSCRSLNILLGLTIVGAWPPAWGWLLAIVIGVYIAGVTWFASTEAKVSSQPMLIGAAIVMLVSLLLALTVPALALEIPTNNFQPSSLFPYLLCLFGAFLGIAVIRAIRQPQPRQVQSVIKRALLGLVAFDALLASAFVGSAGLLLALLLLPGIILGRWLYST